MTLNVHYTSELFGTSSAFLVITGALARVQSILKARFR